MQCRVHAIFGGEDFNPLYFGVSNFLAQADLPYMSRNTQMSYFYSFLGVPFKTYPKVLSYQENLLIGRFFLFLTIFDNKYFRIVGFGPSNVGLGK